MVERFSPADVQREADLARWRTITAPRVAAQQNDFYRQLHDLEMADPANEELRWRIAKGRQLRPVGGGAPSLPVTLATMTGAAVVNTTFTTAQSIITASATPGPAYTGPVGPFLVDYFKTVGASWEQEAMGIIGTTGTPTIAFGTYFGVLIGTITTVLAISPTITTASALANIPWYWKAMGRTVAVSGATSTMLVMGLLFGNIEVLGATVAGEPVQYAVNATPPTAVTVDLSTVAFMDLKATWGTSSASNTITTHFYKLLSLYS